MIKYFLTFASALPLLAVPDGYEISNWAEPFDVDYPTALTAAPDGTVYVSVDRNGSLGKDPKMGKIVSCRDTNGDGMADRFVDFVPDVDSPRGGHFVKDTLYLIHPPYLSSFRDTDGDGVSDEHKILLENIGFGLRHPRGSDHTTNGCRMGIDGWLYIAVGDFGMEATKGTDGKIVTLHGGGVARVRPDGTDLEVYSYHTRNICDIAITPTLDLFTRDNTNDGKGWNIRVHHLTNGSEHGYPRLYKNFTDEAVKPILDLGGGSGTGALYLAEPGHEELLLTCDWTTGKIYHDKVTRKGADFTLEESVWMNLTRAVDIDVDGSGNLYACDWRDGRFKFAGEGKKVGMVQKLVKKGFQGAQFPDLTQLKTAELVAQLKSLSAIRRLESQRELLSRQSNEAHEQLASLALSNVAIETKVAAIFTLAQLKEVSADDLLEAFADQWDAHPEIHEFLLRAAGDLGGRISRKSSELVLACLDSANPRAQLQATIALMRVQGPDPKSSAKIIKMVSESADPRIQNTAIRALVRIGDSNALINHSEHQVARLALMRLHRPEVVSGVTAKMIQSSGEERMGLIEVLGRLFYREAKWDLKAWWGTRPDDRGPYFSPETWEETPRIKSALEEVFQKLAISEREEMLRVLGMNRLAISELKLGDQDPFTMALVSPNPDQNQINILTSAAKDSKRLWAERLKGYRALGRIDEGKAVKNQIEILGAWLDQEIASADVERELTDFINQPALILSTKTLREIAAKGSKSESRVAWRTLLTFSQSPLIKENQKEGIRKMIQKNPREEGLFLALADMVLPGFEQQIEAAINSDNDTLIEAAKRAKMIIEKAQASGGKRVMEFEKAEVMKLALAAQGNASKGKVLYTRQGCIACHAVDQQAEQKGPYLGSSGSKFTKDYLIQSILEPNAVVAQGFQTEIITMKDGVVHYGFVTREEDGVVDLRNIAGVLTQLKVGAIQKRDHQTQSMMPVGLADALTVSEFHDLIAYLVSMKE